VLALLLVAVALGLSNLAAAIGLGTGGVGGAVRVRVAVVFGLFEAGMPLLGLLLGHDVAGSLGHAARWLGGGILIAIGCYGLLQARNQRASPRGSDGGGKRKLGTIVLSGLALSIDNLAAGFALGAYHVAFVVAAVLIGAVSVAMSLAGLELGARLGAALAERDAHSRRGAPAGAELAAGVILVAVGAAMVAGML
jgi:manganese efflux pump family protein